MSKKRNRRRKPEEWHLAVRREAATVIRKLVPEISEQPEHTPPLLRDAKKARLFFNS